MVVSRHTLRKESLTTVNTETTLQEALEVFNKTNYLSIPVMDREGNDLKGVLYKAKIYEGLFESVLSKEEYLVQKVEKVYSPKTIEIQAKSILEEAADLLTDAKLSFIPVYDGTKFIGILTHTAIFKAYSDLLGIHKGTRISIRVANIKGRLAVLSSAVTKLGGNIISFAIEDIKVMNVFRMVIRVEDCDIQELVNVLEKRGFKVERID